MDETVKTRLLPQYAKLAGTHAAKFSGRLPLARLPRLVAALAGDDAELQVTLEVDRGRDGALRLSGLLRGELPLLCQRCLQPFVWTLAAPVALRLVFSEGEEARVLRDEEPYRVDDDRLPLHELVEEEVLLALPFAPRCAKPGCSAN